MDPSTSFSAENRDIEQLRTFVDQTTTDVADLRNKLERQEERVEAFSEEVNAPGAKLAHARADKLEIRLIAAMARQDAAYNRYAATVESVNKTTVVVSRSAAGKGK
jgi:outer membrane murein-binding lipoprotein Lpp